MLTTELTFLWGYWIDSENDATVSKLFGWSIGGSWFLCISVGICFSFSVCGVSIVLVVLVVLIVLGISFVLGISRISGVCSIICRRILISTVCCISCISITFSFLQSSSSCIGWDVSQIVNNNELISRDANWLLWLDWYSISESIILSVNCLVIVDSCRSCYIHWSFLISDSLLEDHTSCEVLFSGSLEFSVGWVTLATYAWVTRVTRVICIISVLSSSCISINYSAVVWISLVVSLVTNWSKNVKLIIFDDIDVEASVSIELYSWVSTLSFHVIDTNLSSRDDSLNLL